MSARWLWIAPTSHYAGGTRPRIAYLPADEWHCDPGTRSGDLALLYRAAQQDVVGILAARSTPRMTREGSSVMGAWVCRFEIVTRFEQPVPIREIPDAPWRTWSTRSASAPPRLSPAQWNAVLRRGLTVAA
jgi:hypothetical protein